MVTFSPSRRESLVGFLWGKSGLIAVSRDRLTKAGIWTASIVAHGLVFILMGMHAPGVRRIVVDRPPPPIDVILYEPPPEPPDLREQRAAVAPPQADAMPPMPRETPPEPNSVPAPIPKPAPPKETVREAPPVPAPPRPKEKETPRPAPPTPAPQPREKDRPQEAAPKPSPVKPREVAKDAPPAPMAPLPMAPAPKSSAPPGPAAQGQAGGGGRPLPDWGVKPGGDLRDAMRGSSAGCANRAAVGLNRREKEKCDERFGEGAKDADFIAAPIGRDKRDRFDATAARKDADRKWKEGGVPPGIDPGASPGQITGLDKPK